MSLVSNTFTSHPFYQEPTRILGESQSSQKPPIDKNKKSDSFELQLVSLFRKFSYENSINLKLERERIDEESKNEAEKIERLIALGAIAQELEKDELSRSFLDEAQEKLSKGEWEKLGDLEVISSLYFQLVEMRNLQISKNENCRSSERKSNEMPIYVKSLNLMTNTCINHLQYDAAKVHAEKMISLYPSDLPIPPLGLGFAYRNLGRIYLRAPDYLKAEEFFKKSLDVFLCHLGEKSVDVADAYNNLGLTNIHLCKFGEAETFLLKSEKIHAEISNFEGLSICCSNLGLLYSKTGDYNKSEKAYERSIQIVIEVYGNNSPILAMKYNNFGSMICERAKLLSQKEERVKAFQESKSIQLKCMGFVGFVEKSSASLFYYNLGVCCVGLEEWDEAEACFNKALEMRASIYPADHQKIQNVKGWIKHIQNTKKKSLQ